MNYLNTTGQKILFECDLNDEVFVDKSLLIETISKRINTNKRCVCITKPRRFGKTMNARMLAAYYTKGLDSGKLFHELAISDTKDYKKHLNQHNVIYIDFSLLPDECGSYADYIGFIREQFYEDLEEVYGKKQQKSLMNFLNSTEEQFIFILDEWDSIFYEEFMTAADKKAHLKFLKSLLKDKPYVELAYMTGVMPVSKHSSGSELNMFTEYSFLNDGVFDEYFGFTKEEVQKLCEEHKKPSYEELKSWYDGYYTYDGKSLFNPRSVSMALSDGICKNYWTETGPMNEIAGFIEHNVDEVRDDIIRLVSGIPVEIELDGYSAIEQSLETRNEILSAMVVFGFLSYYDKKLVIPNYELMKKFQRVLARKSFGGIREVVERSREIYEATLACDGETVAEFLEYAHSREVPVLKYHDENSIACVISLCYLYARDYYKIKRELHTGKGFCDFIFFPKKEGLPGIVMELKKGKSAEEALLQIKERNYMQELEEYKEILLVGINYDEKKHHECKIEKWR